MPSLFSQVVSAFRGTPARTSPFKEAGKSGTPIIGGMVDLREMHPDLRGPDRFTTAESILANVSAVAAGTRFFLNLVAKPSWKIEPAKDLPDGESSDAAKKVAEFVEAVLEDMDTAWPRIVRRSAMYRYWGFGIQEWTAKRREDGLVGLLDVEPRPQRTIQRWEKDKAGKIIGVWQADVEGGPDLWIPREKTMYLVDDALTDSPEGMGLFRHLAEPAAALRALLKLEGIGFERDLRGLPVGWAPLGEINEAVESGELTEAQGEEMVRGLTAFVKMQAKRQDTGVLLDSATYMAKSDTGESVSQAKKWGIDLLSTNASGLADLGKAIERLSMDCARIVGTEVMYLGAGPSGSRALSSDKSSNLYLNVMATIGDIVEGAERDVFRPVLDLNGIPRVLTPKAKVEEVAPRDVDQITASLRDLATAGGILAPDDPAIDDVRDLLGVSRQPEMTPERMALLMPPPPPPPGGSGGQPPKEKPRA